MMNRSEPRYESIGIPSADTGTRRRRIRPSGRSQPADRPAVRRCRVRRNRPGEERARRISRSSSCEPRRIRQLPEARQAAGRSRPGLCGRLAGPRLARPARQPRPGHRGPACIGRARASPPGWTWSRSSYCDMLAKHGVEPITALGQPFDPNFHEAIIQQPDADHPEGTVVAELGKGYRIQRPRPRPPRSPSPSSTGRSRSLETRKRCIER